MTFVETATEPDSGDTSICGGAGALDVSNARHISKHPDNLVEPGRLILADAV